MSKKSKREKQAQNPPSQPKFTYKRFPVIIGGVIAASAIIVLFITQQATDSSTPTAQISSVSALSKTVSNSTSPTPLVKVYKSASCLCCGKWVEHMRDAGFSVETHNRNDMQSIKSRFGISPQQGSCHTALIDGYLIEGHVPATDVLRLLDEKPDVRGLTVPGMVMGSPGMEGPRSDHYTVDTLPKQNQKTSVYARY